MLALADEGEVNFRGMTNTDNEGAGNIDPRGLDLQLRALRKV